MNGSDSDDENTAPAADLEQCRSALTQCGEILGRPDISTSPDLAVDFIRAKLTEKRQKTGENRALRDRISTLTSLSPCTPSSLQLLIDAKSRDLQSVRDELDRIEKERQSLELKIESAKKAEHHNGQIATMIASLQQMTKQLDIETAAVNALQQEETQLKTELSGRVRSDIRNELAAEQTKRLNIQHAIDSLRAEEEKRMIARTLFLKEKKTALQSKLSSISDQKAEVLAERERVQELRKEIERFEGLMSRERKRPESPLKQPQEEEKPPVNKDRVGRLILMLLSGEATKAVFQSLSEELDWTAKQSGDFLAIVRGGNERGLGTQWAEWLNNLVNDE
jgi:DNA repair exonuclease SbcCD ATPase subunit